MAYTDIKNIEECPICLEVLDLGDIAILGCPKKHKFHFICIGTWIYNRNNDNKFTCPLCLVEDVEIEDVLKSQNNNKYDHLFVWGNIFKKSINRKRKKSKNKIDNTFKKSPCCNCLGCIIV